MRQTIFTVLVFRRILHVRSQFKTFRKFVSRLFIFTISMTIHRNYKKTKKKKKKKLLTFKGCHIEQFSFHQTTHMATRSRKIFRSNNFLSPLLLFADENFASLVSIDRKKTVSLLSSFSFFTFTFSRACCPIGSPLALLRKRNAGKNWSENQRRCHWQPIKFKKTLLIPFRRNFAGIFARLVRVTPRQAHGHDETIVTGKERRKRTACCDLVSP